MEQHYKYARGEQKDRRLMDMVADLAGDNSVVLEGNNDLRDAIVEIAESVSPSPGPSPTPTPSAEFRVIESTVDWGGINTFVSSDKAEVAEAVGMTEEELDALFDYENPTPIMLSFKAMNDYGDGYTMQYFFAPLYRNININPAPSTLDYCECSFYLPRDVEFEGNICISLVYFAGGGNHPSRYEIYGLGYEDET